MNNNISIKNTLISNTSANTNNSNQTNNIIDDNSINPISNTYNDEHLLSLSKQEIINIKNTKISELTDILEELIKQNEDLKENYAKSVSFFKHYIETLEKETDIINSYDANISNNVFSTSIPANKLVSINNDIKNKDIENKESPIIHNNIIGSFIKCEYCEEIMIISELKNHKDFYISLKEMEYRINNKDYEGISDAIKHGFNIKLVIDEKNQNSKKHNIILYKLSIIF